MIYSTSFSRTILLSLAVTLSTSALPQTNGPTGQILTASPSSTITSLASTTPTRASTSAASTSNDVPLSLWSGAVGLLSSYYPTSTPSNLATATWPDTVVIDSKTYSVHPASSATGSPTTSVLAEATSLAPTNKSHGGLTSDKKVGVAVGVAVGAVALIVLAVVLCCLHRRKRATGAWFQRRPTPSVTDSDLESWRPSPRQQAPMMSMIPAPSVWNDKYDSLARGPGAEGPEPGGAFGILRPPPAAVHPAFARQQSNYSSSEDNPFFTPEERSQQYESAEEGGTTPRNEMAAFGVLDSGSGRNSTDTLRQTSRPPTPFSPFMMMAGGAGPRHDQAEHNPFVSPEDDDYEEERDLVSPIIPTRSPERRHSPMIHYPSWNEISEFDFTGDGQPRAVRAQQSYQSYEGSDDGWRPARDSVQGRYELA
jgi:hypothetical protein